MKSIADNHKVNRDVLRHIVRVESAAQPPAQPSLQPGMMGDVKARQRGVRGRNGGGHGFRIAGQKDARMIIENGYRFKFVGWPAEWV